MKRLSWGMKIGVGVAVFGLGLLGTGLYYTLTTRNAPIPAPFPLPKPNGYDFYVAAAQSLVPAKPPVDAILDPVRLAPAQAAVNYSEARRQNWIAANSKSWNLLARALTTPARNSTPRLSALALTPGYRQLRELARAQSIRSHDFQARGQWNAALSNGLDTLQMGRDIERGAPLIGALVGIAVEAVSLRELEKLPSHLSASEARAGALRLEKLIAGAAPFSAVLTEEKWSFASYITQNWDKPGNGGGEIGPRLLFPKTRVVRSNNALLDRFIAQADKPAGSQSTISEPPIWELQAKILYPVLPRALWNNERRQTSENLLLLRLALRAYRLENGAYPAKIAALAPKYLAAIPIDAFGRGEAMRYRTSGDTYTLWSIGPDGIDNSAAPILNKLGHKPKFYAPESRGDVVAEP